MPRQDASLFVVATPIGNLQDITLRALEVLGAVEAVVSENVRKTRNLLEHFGLTTRVLSYREENAGRMGAVIVGMLKEGKSVALVAEAGTPGVSDPGRLLVRTVREQGFRVVPVPGASALAAAISISGLDEQRFVFEGFLPRKASKRRQRLSELAGERRAIVLFEAPHRVLECLRDMAAALGDRQCVVARELTKLHEEVEGGSISHFVAKYAARQPVGEFVMISEGAGEVGSGSSALPDVSFEEAVSEARELVAGGRRKKDAAKLVEKKHHLARGAVYRALAGAKEKGDARCK
jgi:16S rRNA (cytidine1402-2'-O)-methyltransferase